MTRQQLMAQVASSVMVAVCVLALPALAQDCPELVYHWPGPVSAVAISGDYAYLVVPAGLVVADVSVPSMPRVVGEVALPYAAISVAISGGYAYVMGSGRLWVVDVSTPSAPIEVGDLTLHWAIDVAVEGGHAYVATSGYGPSPGLAVIDVSTPSHPVGVGFVETEGWPTSVAVSGDHAYLAARDVGLRVIDVSTPSTPVVVGYVNTRGSEVEVSVDYAYVVNSDDGLRVIDISTPSAPVEVGSVEAWGNDVAVAGGYAYVAGGGLQVIDVSTPSAPVEVGYVGTPGYAGDVAVSGGFVHVVGEEGRFQVIDVSTPSAPVEMGFLDGLRAFDVAGSAGYVYVAGSRPPFSFGYALVTFDLSNSAEPVQVSRLIGPDEHEPTIDDISVAVSGDYVYAMLTGCGVPSCHTSLRVIDVSTPSAPVEVGFVGWDDGGSSAGLAVEGDYAYVTGAAAGLRVIDVSAPSAPVEVGFVALPGTDVYQGIAVHRWYAYVATSVWASGNWEGRLEIINVSTPSAPLEVSFVDIPGGAFNVAISGDYAYVVGDGLHVINISTPSAPIEVGAIDTGWATDVAISGDYAYVVGDGLHVIDVLIPSSPVEAGFHETEFLDGTGPILPKVAVSERSVCVTGGDVGLYAFSECDPLADARECFIPAAAVAAGAQGAFFQTDVEINNTGTEETQVAFQWLPRGEDNSAPVESDPITLAAGQSLRYENVLTELFNLQPDSLGALKLVASTESVIGMSRTYNSPEGKVAGTFGQGLPAIRATEMIKRTQPRRIIFLSEDFASRANVGCVNGSSEPVTINVELFNSQGESLEVKTMDLGPWSNDQINHVFQGHLMGNGYVDVWADSVDALYYCYGSVLDNVTSDPTTILPLVPSADTTYVPAAALAAGLEGSFFQTDLDLNNVGSTDLTYALLWLPRGADNSDPVHSDTFSLAPGAGVRYANVLDEVFGLEPDQVGALAIEAGGVDLLAMSRTYNLPSAKVAGTFGQELPGVPADRMIPTGVKKRIIFMSENDDVRANVGCVNGAGIEVAVAIDLYGSDGALLETRYMMLPPYSNRQINGVFRDYAPINGYVDVRTYTPDASIYCYGSVLDNLTSDPTTVLPQ